MSRRTELVTIGDALQIIDRVRWVRRVAKQISLDLEPAAGVWTYFDRLIIDPGVSHLTNDRYGAHVRLMGYAWKSDPPGSLPDDDRRLRAWCHDPPDWDAFKADLFGTESAWRLHEGRWYQVGLCRAYLEQIVRRLRRMWAAAAKHAREGKTRAARERATQLHERCRTIHDSLESRAFQPLLFAPDERVPDPEPDAQQLSLFADGSGGCVLDFPREGDVSGGCVPSERVPDVAEVDAGGCVPQFAVAGGSGGCVPDAVGFDPDPGGRVLDQDQQGALLEWPEVTDSGGCVPDPSLGSLDFDPDFAPAWADLEARDSSNPPSFTGGCVPNVDVEEIPPKSLPDRALCNAPAMHALSMSRSMSKEEPRSSKLAGAHARDGPRESFAAEIFQIFRDLTGQRRLPLPGEVELAGEWFDRGLSVGQVELLFRQRLASKEVTWMTYFRRVEALDEHSPGLPRSDIESDRRSMLKALDGLDLDAEQRARVDAARIRERAMAARTALDLERIEHDIEEALDGERSEF